MVRNLDRANSYAGGAQVALESWISPQRCAHSFLIQLPAVNPAIAPAQQSSRKETEWRNGVIPTTLPELQRVVQATSSSSARYGGDGDGGRGGG
eukprot:7853262-Pyramimonas_sp.AAC.1